MREAAADLDFEEAARLRDEIKRLRATELAVIDDPTAKYPGAPQAGRLPSPRGGGGLAVRGSRCGVGVARARPAQTHPRRDGPRRGIDPRRPRQADGPGPRSTSGRAGMRGGWKPRGR